jgi:hypothetical protein
LLVDDLIARYDTATLVDGLMTGEGASLACTFWLADVRILQNRGSDAIRQFKRLVGT